jgi:alanine dehydrogenase
MAILLTADDVQRATDFEGVLRALDRAHRDEYLGHTTITERFNLRFEGGWMRLMAAALPTLGVVGYKEFHLIGSSLKIQINLFDIESGELLACLDGNYLTVLRTASTAALAAARLAREASVVGIIGSGAEARMQATVLSLLLDKMDRVLVYSPRKERRERFAEELSAQIGVDIEPCQDAAGAAASADLIMVATNTGGAGPAFFADWIPAAAHVSSTGSTLPEERELDSDVWKYPELIVVDRMQALEESGDAIAAAKAGTLDPSRVITLAELWGRRAAGAVPRRTLYKSVGSPLQDVAVAAYAYQNAKERGLGTGIPEFLSVKKTIPIVAGGGGERSRR